MRPTQSIVKKNRRLALLTAFTAFQLAGLGCAPTVALQAPDKPLEINLNVKVDHKISVKVDKQLEEVMNKNDAIF